MNAPKYVFNSKNSTKATNWIIVDDTVMGGKSAGAFKINELGNAVFYGEVSLENNGGFSSIRYRGASVTIEGSSKIVLKLKGDGKRYQFRINENTNQRHSYVSYFTTSGDWETIEISLANLVPKFRGRQLDIPNFSGNTIAEIGFLIGNKKAEAFELIISDVMLIP